MLHRKMSSLEQMKLSIVSESPLSTLFYSNIVCDMFLNHNQVEYRYIGISVSVYIVLVCLKPLRKIDLSNECQTNSATTRSFVTRKNKVIT